MLILVRRNGCTIEVPSIPDLADLLGLIGGSGEGGRGTLQDLKAADLGIGVKVQTAGYFAVGDGGEGFYQVVGPGTGPADDAFFVNMINGNQAELLLEDPTTMRVRLLGAIMDGVTDDAARLAVGEASNVTNFDLGGRQVLVTTFGQFLTKRYFNGPPLITHTPLGYPSTYKKQVATADTELQRPRTKSPLQVWTDENFLGLGTSIDAIGAGVNGIYELACLAIEANVDNFAWPGSHITWTLDNALVDQFEIHASSALSMTEEDRLAGFALYGVGSAYDDNLHPITKSSQMTCDYRIDDPFFLTSFRASLLGHHHNDRYIAPGTLSPESIAITAITKGVTTQITLASIGTVVVGNGIAIEVIGIPFLNHAAHRVQSVAGNIITINVDSSGYSGAFVSGTLRKLDRYTIFGGWEFIIHRIYCAAIRAGRTIPVPGQPPLASDHFIILMGAPNEFTGGSYSPEVHSIYDYLQQVAAKWNLSIYDPAYEYDIKFHDLYNYFDDGTHANTVAERRPLGNMLAKYLSGGVTKFPVASDSLPAGIVKTYDDQQPAIYNRFFNGFGTPHVRTPPAVVTFSENFAGGIGTLTQVNAVIPATFVAAPWGGGASAARFLVPAAAVAPKTSALQKAIVLGAGQRVRWDAYFPVVSGLTSAVNPASVTLMEVRSTGAYLFIIGIIHPTKLNFNFEYFHTANTTLTIEPATDFEAIAGFKHAFEIEHYKETATDLGKLRFLIDGKLLGVYDTSDIGQTAIANVRIGAEAVNSLHDFEVYMSNLEIAEFTPGPPLLSAQFGLQLKSETKAVIGALTPTLGLEFMCTDEAGGSVPVFGDGAAWRRVTDRAVMS